MLNVEFSTELLKSLVIELLTIIGDKGMENSKSTYDRFLEELFDFSLCDLCQGLSFHLFDEVINSD